MTRECESTVRHSFYDHHNSTSTWMGLTRAPTLFMVSAEYRICDLIGNTQEPSSDDPTIDQAVALSLDYMLCSLSTYAPTLE